MDDIKTDSEPLSGSGGGLLYRIEERTAWLVLNRPDKRNALDRDTLGLMDEALRRADADAAVRVLVITGTGPAFCAGADLEDVPGRTGQAGTARPDFLDHLHATLRAVRAFRKPVIGALNGVTAAGGLELALCCDLLVAARNTRIGDAHINFGLIPGAGGATVLPRRIGLNRAKRLLLTGEFVPAVTLHDWGLIDWVVADDELPAFAAGIARELAAKSAAALEAIKRLANDAVSCSLLDHEASTLREHLTSRDAQEGLSAFREKRMPVFE
jgi:enoyl-CoA hydratase